MGPTQEVIHKNKSKPEDKPLPPPFTVRGIAEEMNQPGLFKHPSAKGLGVRVTANGAKSFVFDRRVKGQKVRVVIGRAPLRVNDVGAMTVPQALAIVADLNREAEAGRDPRAIRLEAAAADAASLAKVKAERDRLNVTFGHLWADYVAERSTAMVRSRATGKIKAAWSESQKRDAAKVSRPGGQPLKNRQGLSTPGPLAVLMREPLALLDEATLAVWSQKEAKKRATQAALAFRHLSAALKWGAQSEHYAPLIRADALAPRRAMELLGGQTAAKGEEDCLQRSQLAAFFSALAKVSPTMKAYFIFVLMTGARRNEAAGLRWADVDMRGLKLTLRDKVRGTRLVPLSPYLVALLNGQHRVNGFVFPSKSKSGHIETPTRALQDVCAEAGVTVTIHGLRRTFATLWEHFDLPEGAGRQIRGHTAQGASERSYKRRTLDALRDLLTRYEAGILTAAGIDFVPEAEGLRLVKA